MAFILRDLLIPNERLLIPSERLTGRFAVPGLNKTAAEFHPNVLAESGAREDRAFFHTSFTAHTKQANRLPRRLTTPVRRALQAGVRSTWLWAKSQGNRANYGLEQLASPRFRALVGRRSDYYNEILRSAQLPTIPGHARSELPAALD